MFFSAWIAKKLFSRVYMEEGKSEEKDDDDGESLKVVLFFGLSGKTLFGFGKD